MHRVNIKSNRVIALRVVAYSVTIFLSIVTTVLLLLIALGYRFNRDGKVIHSGLVLIDNKPEAAQIYIDGKLEDSRSPGRFVIPIGRYEISLELDGYKGWKKNFEIKKEVVERVDYPLLIPKKLTASPQITISSPQLLTQSPNRKNLVYYVASDNSLKIIDLNPDKPVETSIIIPAAFSREAGSVGALSTIEWSKNSKNVLINQALPSGINKVVSLDINNPANSVNITDRFAQIAPSYVNYLGSKTDIIYGLNQGILRQYNLANGESTFVLDGVQSYQNFGDKTVAFTRLSPTSNKIEAGVLKSDQKAVLEQFDSTAVKPKIAYGEFDDHTYLAISSDDAVRVYRDALNQPILKKQIPYVKLPIVSADFIKFSPNNQYLVVRSSTNYAAFDFENVRSSNFSITRQIKSDSLDWMNDSHLSYQAVDGQNFIIEFDGMNKSGLVKSDLGTGLFYSSDYRNTFRVNTEGAKTTLDLVLLTVK
ncbi:PEGA domain-containing protein [Candidatus Nomurabacteria bacterium]|nr:PEGA domain-containing protein [Candidatus Nomurabacteria bacterium]